MRAKAKAPDSNIWGCILGNGDAFKSAVNTLTGQGEAILEYVKLDNSKYLASCGFETELSGLRGICLNRLASSQAFEGSYDPAKHDMMIAFVRQSNKWRVSMFSQKAEVDCSAIAKKHGGGGHKGAAGVTIDAKKKDQFVKNIYKSAEVNINDKDLVKKIKVDVAIDFHEISMRLYDTIENLMPFGMGNPKPVFTTSGAEIVDHRKVGRDEKHLSLKMKEAGREIGGIYFGFEDCSTVKYDNIKYDIAYQIIEDNWSGSRELKLQILDIKETNRHPTSLKLRGAGKSSPQINTNE